MMRCDHCQSLLLDHLYGLLDPAEAAAVEQHLAGCPGCAAARDHEARAQGLFARAAKSEFPQVRFTTPVAEPTVAAPAARSDTLTSTPARPLTPPASPKRRVGAIAGWAVAAAVLVGLSVAVLAINGRIERANSTRGELATASVNATEAEKAYQQARDEVAGQRARVAAGLEQAKENHDRLLADWVAAEKAAIGNPPDRRLAVQVVKPAVIQPGAPNIFELTVMDIGGNVPFTEPILAEVRDQTGKTVYATEFDHTKRGRVGHLRLPAEVWSRVHPDDELFLAIATVDPKTRAKTDLQEPIRLYGPVYTTLLVTDRSSYRRGDLVYFRSLTLDRVTFRSPNYEQVLRFELSRKTADRMVPVGTVVGSTNLVRVTDGKVEPVTGPDGEPLRGVGCGAFALPSDLPDGEYTLTLTELPPPGGYPPSIAFPVTRTIQVRSGATEQYQKRIAFVSAGFAPGDQAEGWAELKAQNNPVANVPAHVIAVNSSGEPLQVTPSQAVTGPDGRVQFRIELKKGMPPGEVRVKVTFHTPDRPEETAERVPLIGSNLIVEFFPEGGSLVAGVPCRVYVRATMPSGEPADIRGVILDDHGAVARVETMRDPEAGINRGLGSFTFTPKASTVYRLKLESPTGPFEPLRVDPLPARDFPFGPVAAVGAPGFIATRSGFVLPPVGGAGVVMSVSNPVAGPNEPFKVRLHAVNPPAVNRPRTFVVGAYTRGRLSDSQRVTIAANESPEVLLKQGRDSRGGVTRITVFEDYPPPPGRPRQDLVPVAERLVFRRPAESLNLALTTSAGVPLGKLPAFTPGSAVDLKVRATNEKGKATPAVLFATVTNAGGTEDRKARLLTTQFLIAGEVQNPDDLEYADFLLSDDPRAATSLDLVLATQGWRRLVEQDQVPLAELRQLADDPRERLIVMNGGYPVRVEPGDVRRQHVYNAYGPQYDTAAKELDAARKAKAAADADTSGEARVGDLLSAYDARRQELDELTGRAESAAAALAAVDRVRMPALVGLVVVALGLAGFLAIRRPRLTTSIPLGLTAAGLLGLAVFLAVTGDRAAPGNANEPIAGQEPDGSNTAKSNKSEGSEGIKPPLPKSDDGSPFKAQATMQAPGGAESGTVRMSGQALAQPGGPGVMSIQRPAAMTQGNWRPGGEAEKKIPRSLLPDPLRLKKVPEDRPAAFMAMSAPSPFREDFQVSAKRATEFARDRGQPAADRLNALTATEPPDRLALDRVRAAAIPPTPLVVREYAAPRPGSQRMPDGPDTVLWQPVIVLPGDGETTLSFTIGHSKGYEVIVAGHTLDGRIGATRGLLPVAPTVTDPAK